MKPMPAAGQTALILPQNRQRDAQAKNPVVAIHRHRAAVTLHDALHADHAEAVILPVGFCRDRKPVLEHDCFFAAILYLNIEKLSPSGSSDPDKPTLPIRHFEFRTDSVIDRIAEQGINVPCPHKRERFAVDHISEGDALLLTDEVFACQHDIQRFTARLSNGIIDDYGVPPFP